MKRAGIFVVVLSTWPLASALADEQMPVDPATPNGAVSGILDGVVVGTTRRTVDRKRDSSYGYDRRGGRDSFSMNSNNDESKRDIRKNRIQTRSEMIPSLDTSTTPPSADVPSTSHDTDAAIGDKINNATAAGAAAVNGNPQYYKQLVDQVKSQSGSAADGASPQKGKYQVTDKDRF